ncbi:MAG TPA: TetR/AcrR family transcriptional regulator [Candidatus Saccharimonadia bacterium]|nr:TetR/AcrR family transcriptional regulator [Candidatus Saccharimonadia bacterium]
MNDLPPSPSKPVPGRRSKSGEAGVQTTKRAILDAAEDLFAERGIDATSVRDITQTAGVNLGAIHYHFGSKNELIVEVFSRGLTPLNQMRMNLLAQVEQAAGKDALPLEEVLRAFIKPTVEYLVAEDGTPIKFLRLLCRCFQEPHPQLATLLAEHFQELFLRFNKGLLRAVPGMPEGELFWRMTFMFGSLHQSLDTWVQFDSNPFTCMEGAPRAARLSRDELGEALISYSTAGFRSAGSRA